MSEISRLIIEQGREAAEARRAGGAIWGRAFEAIGQIPQATQLAQQQQREQRLHEALGQQRLAEGAATLADKQRLNQGRDRLATAIQAFSHVDPETGHLVTDADQVYQQVAVTHPDVARSFLDDWDARERVIADTQHKTLEIAANKAKLQANFLGSVLDAAPEAKATAYASMLGQAQALFRGHPELAARFSDLPPVYGPDAEAILRQRVEQSRTEGERIAEALKKAETHKAEAEAQKAAAEAARGPVPTEAALDAEQQRRLTKQRLGQLLTPTEEAEMAAYTERRRTVSSPAQEAAAARQASAQEAATALQARAQAFTEAQAGRAELQKSEKEVLDAQEKGRTLRNIVRAAQAGNAVAGSLTPLLTALDVVTTEGVKRINVPEIQTVTGAGSLKTRLEGWIGKQKSGQPLAPELQQHVLEIADLLEAAATEKYQAHYPRIIKTYGVTGYEPLPARPSTRPDPTDPNWGRH